MRAHLEPGSICSYVSPRGLKLRCVVAETLPFPKIRGEEELIPVTRLIRKRGNKVNIDHPGASKPAKVKWIARRLLRKLPSKAQ